MEFFRQEYCSGLACPPPGDLSEPGIQPASPVSPALQADSLPAELFVPIISVQSFSRVPLFVTPRTAAHQASLSITNSRSPPKPMSIESVMPSNHLILLFIPFSSCLQSCPASESFPMSWLYASGGQSIVVSASASVLPMNSQG